MLLGNTTMAERFSEDPKVEFPDDYAIATFTLAAAKTGNQKTTTMRAFNETELKRIADKIP
jgi:uncharacterized protein with GYD domain